MAAARSTANSDGGNGPTGDGSTGGDAAIGGNGSVAESSPPADFEPLARATLSGQIRDRLLERIATGVLAPGSQVPSERSLSEQFKVARTSVREAMQGLVSIGVIERRGNRSYVAERLPDVRVEARDGRKDFVQQLFETRRALEIPITELAARRASDDDRTEIRRLAAQFHGDLPLADFRSLDHRFHALIARASGNPLLVELYGKVLSTLFKSADFESLLYADENRDAVQGLVSESGQHHKAIARAIADADEAAAAGASTEHLNAVEQHMLDRLV